jgi:hypothetical protein
MTSYPFMLSGKRFFEYLDHELPGGKNAHILNPLQFQEMPVARTSATALATSAMTSSSVYC